MQYKRVEIKRGNTPIATAELSFVEKAIFTVADKACVEIWGEKNREVVGSIYPGQRLIVTKEDFRYENTPNEG